jgi:hypothetical protein
MKTDTTKIKTTLRMYRWLWKEVQHRAIEEETTAEAIVVRALLDYLKINPKDIGIVVTYERRKKGGKS